MENNNTSVIDLVDNTVPSVQPSGRTPSQSQPATGPAALAKLLTRGSIKSELAKRKYAKWQPDRLGVTDNPAIDERPLSPAPSTDGKSINTKKISRESAEEQQTGLETTDS